MLLQPPQRSHGDAERERASVKDCHLFGIGTSTAPEVSCRVIVPPFSSARLLLAHFQPADQRQALPELLLTIQGRTTLKHRPKLLGFLIFISSILFSKLGKWLRALPALSRLHSCPSWSHSTLPLKHSVCGGASGRRVVRATLVFVAFSCCNITDGGFHSAIRSNILPQLSSISSIYKKLIEK